jgi:hypothetical protein
MSRWNKEAWHRYMMQGKMEDPRKKMKRVSNGSGELGLVRG